MQHESWMKLTNVSMKARDTNLLGQIQMDTEHPEILRKMSPNIIEREIMVTYVQNQGP